MSDKLVVLHIDAIWTPDMDNDPEKAWELGSKAWLIHPSRVLYSDVAIIVNPKGVVIANKAIKGITRNERYPDRWDIIGGPLT